MQFLTQLSLFNLLAAGHCLVALYGLLLLMLLPNTTNYNQFVAQSTTELTDNQPINGRTLTVALKVLLLIPVINLVTLYYLLGFLATTDKARYSN